MMQEGMLTSFRPTLCDRYRRKRGSRKI